MSPRFAAYGALVALVAQNSMGVIGMRVTRVAAGPMYLVTCAVLITELMKFFTCLYAVYLESKSAAHFVATLRSITALEILRLAVPSLLFYCQNSLVYYAVSNMDAAMFSILYQSKLLTTAFFSVCILRKKFSFVQWIALLLLAAGVALAQYEPADRSASTDDEQDPFLGLIATFLAAIFSGFSAVYLESILKGHDTSLWMRNVQMGITTIPLAIAGVMLSKDRVVVMEHGLFYGFTAMVTMLLVNQAIGGILVAVVMKYADNIMKGFAIAVSLCVTVVLNYLLLDGSPTKYFVVAAIMVAISLGMYLTCGIPTSTSNQSVGIIQPLQKRMSLPARLSNIDEDEEQREPMIEMGNRN